MIVFWIAALGMVLGSGFIKKQSGAVGMSLLFVVGLVLGLAVGPTLTHYATSNGAEVLWQAAGATALFVAGFGVWGYATRRDLAPYVRYFFWALIGLTLRTPGQNAIWVCPGMPITVSAVVAGRRGAPG